MKMAQSGALMTLSALLLIVLPTTAYGDTGATAEYQFHSLPESVAEGDFSERLSERRFSMGTALNNDGRLFGYTLDEQGVFHGYSVLLADNPEMAASDHPGFMILAAPDCGSIFSCLFSALFGIRIDEEGARTALLSSEVDSPASVPFINFPGEFVQANAAGIIASTQLGEESQQGMVLDPARPGPIMLEDIPWLVDINDNDAPQILGYRGAVGDCLVYGENCVPPPDLCDGDDEHPSSNQGQGEGEGHAWGQHPCHRPWLGIEYHARNHCSEDEEGCEPVPGHGSENEFTGPLPARNESVLIQWHDEGSPIQYRFPEHLGTPWAHMTVSEVFPLALNDNTALLRANISDSSNVYWQRLVQCEFEPAGPDTTGDGLVDCIGGLQPVQPPESGTRIRTVLGFSLNNMNTVMGNLGYRSSGIGMPFVLYLDDDTPAPEPLTNLVRGNEARELHTITDLNESGRTIGYGYTDCGVMPDTFFLIPDTESSDSAPRFDRNSLPGTNTRVSPGDSIELSPSTREDGSHEFRFLSRTPDDSDWALQQDWSSQEHYSLDTSGHEGPLCLRIQLRDSGNEHPLREQVVRFLVSDTPLSGEPLPVADDTLVSTSGGGGRLSLPGSAGLLWLLVLTGAGMLRITRRGA